MHGSVTVALGVVEALADYELTGDVEAVYPTGSPSCMSPLTTCNQAFHGTGQVNGNPEITKLT